MVYGVTKGKIIPAKHFLSVLDLHKITRKKMVVEINNKLSHCISYNTSETAQAMRAQQLAEKSSILSVISNSDKDIVLTYLWADKFDHIVDNQTGRGSVNTTHLVAFQEKNGTYHYESNLPTTEQIKRRAIDLTVNEMALSNIKTNVKPLFIENKAVI